APPARLQFGTRALAKRDVPGRVSVAELRHILKLFKPVRGKISDRLEHAVTRAAPADEALVDERGDPVEVCTADLLGSLQRATAGEEGEPCEEVLLGRHQQVVAPDDRRTQRALPLRG